MKDEINILKDRIEFLEQWHGHLIELVNSLELTNNKLIEALEKINDLIYEDSIQGTYKIESVINEALIHYRKGFK